jgi:hypothetical protein
MSVSKLIGSSFSSHSHEELLNKIDQLEQKINKVTSRIIDKASGSEETQTALIERVSLQELTNKLGDLNKKLVLLNASLTPPIVFPPEMRPLPINDQTGGSASTHAPRSNPVPLHYKDRGVNPKDIPIIKADIYISDRDAKWLGNDGFLEFHKNITLIDTVEPNPNEPYFHICCTLLPPSKLPPSKIAISSKQVPTKEEQKAIEALKDKEALEAKELILPSYLFKDRQEGAVISFIYRIEADSELQLTHLHQPTALKIELKKKSVPTEAQQSETADKKTSEESVPTEAQQSETADKKTPEKILIYREIQFQLTLKQSRCLRATYDTETTFQTAYNFLESTLWSQSAFAKYILPYKFVDDISAEYRIIKGSLFTSVYSFENSSLMKKVISDADMQKLKVMDFHATRCRPSPPKYSVNELVWLTAKELKKNWKQFEKAEKDYEKFIKENPIPPIVGPLEGAHVKKGEREYVVLFIDNLEVSTLNIYTGPYQLYVVAENSKIKESRDFALGKQERRPTRYCTYDRFIPKTSEAYLASYNGTSSDHIKKTSKVIGKGAADDTRKEGDYKIVHEDKPPENMKSKEELDLEKNLSQSKFEVPSHLEYTVKNKFPLDQNSIQINLRTCANKAILSAIDGEEIRVLSNRDTKYLFPSEITYYEKTTTFVRGSATFIDQAGPFFMDGKGPDEEGKVSIYLDDSLTHFVAHINLNDVRLRDSIKYLDASQSSFRLVKEILHENFYIDRTEKTINGKVKIYSDEFKTRFQEADLFTRANEKELEKEQNPDHRESPGYINVIYLDAKKSFFVHMHMRIDPQPLAYYTDDDMRTKVSFIISEDLDPSEKFPHQVLVISYKMLKEKDDRFQTAEGKQIEEEIRCDLAAEANKIAEERIFPTLVNNGDKTLGNKENRFQTAEGKKIKKVIPHVLKKKK